MSPATILLLALFIDIVGFGIVVPILPFLVESMGGGAFEGGLLFAVYALMAAIFGPLWGRLSDRIGRKRTLMLTLFGAVVSYIALGLADSLATVFAARALSGMMAGNVGVAVAAMADLSSTEQRTRALGLIGVSFGLGFAVGPGLAAALSAFAGARALSLAGFAAAGLSGLAFLFTWARLPETRPAAASDGGAPAPSLRSFLDRPDRIALVLQFSIAAGVQTMVFSMLGFWTEAVRGWSEREVGLLMIGVGLLIAALQGLVVGPLAARFGEVRTYAGALGCGLAGCLVIVAWPESRLTVLLAFPLTMGGMTLTFPVLNSLVSRRHSASVQGTALGLANGFASLGRIAGPTLAGLAMARHGPGAPFIAAIFVLLPGLLWAAFEIRKSRPRHRESMPPDAPRDPASRD